MLLICKLIKGGVVFDGSRLGTVGVQNTSLIGPKEVATVK